MRKSWTLSLISLVTAALGVTAADATPASAASTTPLRVMPLGDSITLGSSPEHSYRGHLQALLAGAGHSVDFVGSYGNVMPPGGEAVWAGPEASQTNYQGPLDIDFEGHGGFQAGQPQSVVGYPDHMLAQMMPTDLPRFQPDVVLVHIGTNDYLGGWTTCRDTGYHYNTGTASGWLAGFDMGAAADCGTGSYRAWGYGGFLQGGAWRLGSLVTPSLALR